MTLAEQIDKDLIEAAKTANVLARDTLRLVKTAIKNTEIAKGHALSDEEIIDVLAKELKQRQEAETSFRAGSREDLAERESAEAAIIKRYLPEPLPAETIQALVEETIKETGATSLSDMGKVMGALMPKLKGRSDASLVSRLVRERLTAE